MKLLQINNMAPHYRSAIYERIDRELCADFVFGDKVQDICPMDYKQLTHNVTIVHNVYFKYGYYQKGVLRFLFKNYDTYLMTGEFRNITLWMMLLYLCICPKKRSYLWTHGWLGKENKVKRIISKVFFSLADGIFVYNNRSKQLMIEGGVSSRKITTIYNSLDYETQLTIRQALSSTNIFFNHFCNNDKTLIFVGRLTFRKKLDMVIRAMALCREQGLNLNLILVGDGIVKPKLELLTEELGLRNRVWFYGACYDEQLLGHLINNADLCVSPGNVGLTAIHVMMFGCPVITHDDFNHQMPEYEAIQEGRTGVFFRNGDIQSLAETILGWFKNPGYHRESIRQACFCEIDSRWTPMHQIEILKSVLLSR